jgi:hypothetical protein
MTANRTWDPPTVTTYSYGKTAGSLMAYLPRAAMVEKLRASAAESIRSAERLLAALDADEIQISWWRGFKPLPAPDEAAEGQP